MTTHINPYAQTYQGFCEQTQNHTLTVLKEDGLYRHLRVQAPGTHMWGWDVITWPGHLAVTGDIADGYVFTREEDMLRFFSGAGKVDGYYSDGSPSIDFRYWAEKLCGQRQGEVRRYDSRTFISSIETLLDEGDCNPEAIAELRADGYTEEADDLQRRRDDYLRAAKQAADEEHAAVDFLTSRAGDGVVYDDWYEISIKDWTVHFLIACYAIDLTTQLHEQHRAAAARTAEPTLEGANS